MMKRRLPVTFSCALVCVLLSGLNAVSSFGLSMVLKSNVGGKAPSLPRDVKDATSRCRNSVQQALQNRISRMDVEMPVGADFGVEKKSKSNKGRQSPGVDNESVSAAVLERSDRELCRLFVEMFQPLGGEHITAVFNEERQADEAKKKWKGDSSSNCRVMTMGRRGKDKSAAKKKKKKAMGFAAKLNAELSTGGETASGPFKLPDGCEVALFVSPGPKELVVIERLCNEVGMGTLVVLLNARLGRLAKYSSEQAEKLFTKDFESVFHLAAAPQEEAPNCLLHRAYPDDWVMARKPKVGQPKVIAVQEDRLTAEECKEAYENVEIGDVEGVVEGAFETVAGWFNK